MPHDDFEFEPILGLPEALPDQEEILWQGRPQAWALAKDALNIWWVMGYFALLGVWRFIAALDLMAMDQALAISVPFLVLGALCMALLYIVAYVQARTTVYTITNKRVAMRVGAALTLTLNIPFAQVENAAVARWKNGTGNIALKTSGETRISFLMLWPHARAWRFKHTEPTLRCIPDVETVSGILGQAAAPYVGARPTAAPEEKQTDRAPNFEHASLEA